MSKKKPSFDEKLQRSREQAVLLLDPDVTAWLSWMTDEKEIEREKAARVKRLARQVMELRSEG